MLLTSSKFNRIEPIFFSKGLSVTRLTILSSFICQTAKHYLLFLLLFNHDRIGPYATALYCHIEKSSFALHDHLHFSNFLAYLLKKKKKHLFSSDQICFSNLYFSV